MPTDLRDSLMDDLSLSGRLLLSAIGAAGADDGYLIGSRTTGEASMHSDADFLLVINRPADEFECFQVVQRFRDGIRGATPYSVGVRCRRISEVPTFARYLLLQGYDTRFARRISENGTPPGGLEEATTEATGRNEYLCVLGEALWTEVRLRGRRGNAEAAAYEAAKVCLAYLNVALVARGSFLPTNSARVVAWEAEHGCNAGLRDALACKAGASREVSEALLECIARLRDLVLERVPDCKAPAAHFDPAIFWLSTPLDREFGAERAEEMMGICAYLYQLACGRTPTPRAARAPLELHGACTTADGSWSTTAINGFRLRNSVESRRDWGITVDWSHDEQKRIEA